MSYARGPGEDWEGLADPSSGALERPIEGATWSAFGDAVDVAEGQFIVDQDRVFETVRAIRPTVGMLEQFVSISNHNHPSDAAVAFAGRWGLLDICGHWLPVGHPAGVPVSVGIPEIEVRLDQDCQPLGPANGSGQPVIATLFWSEQLHALLNLIARLREGSRGQSRDWKVVRSASQWSKVEGYDAMFADGILDQPTGAQSALREQRALAARSISEFLDVAKVGVGLAWTAGPPRIGTVGGGLFGALWQQVMLAAADDLGTALCAGCGARHHPRRSGPVSFCRACRDKRVPSRQASQRYREKRRQDPKHKASERQRLRDYRRGLRDDYAQESKPGQ